MKNTLLTITQARALARIHTADTDAGLARKRELLAQLVKWHIKRIIEDMAREADMDVGCSQRQTGEVE